jgi:molybdate transport system regulatory protein
MKHDTLIIRISHQSGIAMGPGKAELLETIDRCGSISAASKQMGMSYRRAWELVNVMNDCFNEPLVRTNPGRGNLSGAQVTELGFHVLKCYQSLISKAHAASQDDLNEISHYLKATQ